MWRITARHQVLKVARAGGWRGVMRAHVARVVARMGAMAASQMSRRTVMFVEIEDSISMKPYPQRPSALPLVQGDRAPFHHETGLIEVLPLGSKAYFSAVHSIDC